MPADEISHDPARHRFMIEADGAVGALYYRLAPGVITFYHTEVPAALGGRGIASKLARHGLDYAREQGLRVVATCPFVSAYMKKHPEYDDLLTAGV